MVMLHFGPAERLSESHFVTLDDIVTAFKVAASSKTVFFYFYISHVWKA